MTDRPRQHDIDAVAHFVQAARELRASPFFVEEHRQLGIDRKMSRSGDVVSERYRVPDSKVRDSMVIPFRRIWMPSEPASFDRVANVLKRYAPELRGHVDCLKDFYRQHRKEFALPRLLTLGSGHPDTSPEDIIDMWLNCRLTHTGTQAGKGRFTRADYERTASVIGEAKFEYLFAYACYQIGTSFISLLKIAERTLEKTWASDGLKPTFFYEGEISSNGSRSCSDGVILERSTPGITVAQDDLATKLMLLLRRRAFRGLGDLIQMLEVGNPQCVSILQVAGGIDDVLRSVDLDRQSIDGVPEMARASAFTIVSDDFTNPNQRPWRKGIVAKIASAICMESAAFDILQEQFVALRAELFGDISTD